MGGNEISNRNSSNSSTWMSINSLIHHPYGLWAQRRIRPSKVDCGKEKIESPLKLSLRTFWANHLHIWVHIPDYGYDLRMC